MCVCVCVCLGEKLEYSESKQMKLFEHLLGFEMKRNEGLCFAILVFTERC